MGNSIELFKSRQRRNRTALKKRNSGRPRLSVFRSSQHIYVQLIDDTEGRTLASASSLEKQLRKLKMVVMLKQLQKWVL